MSPEESFQPIFEERVLILMPTHRDAQNTVHIFKANNLSSYICGSLKELCEEISKSAGAAILSEEQILADKTNILYETLRDEPLWSDFPLLVLTPAGHSSAESISALEAIGHMTLIRRPVQIAELMSAVGSALRDRQRQYKMRSYFIERDEQEEALRLADKRKDDFLAILAHELRNPLAPIFNALPILQSQKTTKEMRFEAIDIVVRQVNQMVRLVDDLMDVSRIRGGKIELRKERIKLRDVILNAIETSRPLIDQHNHTLSIDLPEFSVYVEADFVRLSQVISNVLNNAAKYTPHDGHIAIVLEQLGTEGIIRIRDDGIGISKEMLPHIFDMFTQVDESLERAQGGVGIGLMLVKNLIEMHEGSIEARSEGAGKGSEFILRMPLAIKGDEDFIQDNYKEKTPLATQTAGRRILLVEDYKVLAQMTSWALELEGHHVKVAPDGPAAIALAKTYIPEVVLLDIGLPGMNGYEVCAALRQQHALKDTIFIAQTGWGQKEHRQRSKEAGFHYHMVKPIDPAALQGILDSNMSSEKPSKITA